VASEKLGLEKDMPLTSTFGVVPPALIRHLWFFSTPFLGKQKVFNTPKRVSNTFVFWTPLSTGHPWPKIVLPEDHEKVNSPVQVREVRDGRLEKDDMVSYSKGTKLKGRDVV
jgi:hypothetical protein